MITVVWQLGAGDGLEHFREQRVRNPDPMTQPWSQHLAGRQIVLPEEGTLQEDASLRLEQGYAGRGDMYVRESRSLRNQPGKGSWGQGRGTLSEPVPETKLCEFLS